MQIYAKPVRLLMKDFVTQTALTKGEVVSKDQIASWFKTNYPKIKHGTIVAHLSRMSINATSRFHYNANPNGDDDLFYQIDGSHFRLYDPGNDPHPIYSAKDDAQEAPAPQQVEQDESGEAGQTTSEFALEKDLRNFLAKNLSLIEPGLKLYDEEDVSGVEFPAGGRFIDILAVDQANNYVVIELKVSRGYDRVIGQLLRYMAWIEKNQADANQKVRGAIIARDISDDLRLACSKIADVRLYEYSLSVSLSKVL